MKGFIGLICATVAAALLVTGCKKDENTGSVSFLVPAVYFTAEGDKETVRFSTDNIGSLSITNKPLGWPDPVLDAAAQTLTITAPGDKDEDGVTIPSSGTIVLAGVPLGGGTTTTASLFVALAGAKDLGAAANSYLATQKNTHYSFNAKVRPDGAPLATASVDLIWQSASSLVQYTLLDQTGRASFFIGENSEGDYIKEGNALLGAYDASGKLIWSWHIWASNYDPEAKVLVYANGFEVMDRNLGALDNANSTPTEILNSYGLYYQWGRKDPFIGPGSYRADQGASAAMYNNSNGRVYMAEVNADAQTGTQEYAAEHPLTFIAGVKDSKYDWLFNADGNLWAQTKTVNDPCPAGWMVAPEGAFAGLTIKPLDGSAADAFGWQLTDGTLSSLYIGAGRRIYTNGSIQNVYNPLPVRADEAQPWVGYYWTSATAVDGKSAVFHFWFNKADETGGIDRQSPQYRANGMTVRCVRVK